MTTFMGIDPARPGEDQTVIAVHGSLCTAIEIEHRLADYNHRVGNMHDRMRQFSAHLFGLLLTTKVPLIKYGKRKRRHRRLLPAAPAVTISPNAQGDRVPLGRVRARARPRSTNGRGSLICAASG